MANTKDVDNIRRKLHLDIRRNLRMKYVNFLIFFSILTHLITYNIIVIKYVVKNITIFYLYI